MRFIIIHTSFSISSKIILQDLTPIKIPTGPYFQSNCNKIKEWFSNIESQMNDNFVINC